NFVLVDTHDQSPAPPQPTLFRPPTAGASNPLNDEDEGMLSGAYRQARAEESEALGCWGRVLGESFCGIAVSFAHSVRGNPLAFRELCWSKNFCGGMDEAIWFIVVGSILVQIAGGVGVAMGTRHGATGAGTGGSNMK
ncbi:hypothetical protein AKJ16_DCAP04168, partial [Drosera capensis]